MWPDRLPVERARHLPLAEGDEVAPVDHLAHVALQRLATARGGRAVVVERR